MEVTNSNEKRPAIAVFGATGHTGQFVVRELVNRGITPIAVARKFGPGPFAGEVLVQRRQASIDDSRSLDQAFVGAQAVINCAGPFLETGNAVADSAVRAGIHYLDVSAEQTATKAMLDRFDSAAQKAGIVILPAMGFYGGFADLLVTATLDDWNEADSIQVMIGLDSWQPTRGTRLTGERNTTPRVVIANGHIAPMGKPPGEKPWRFSDPIGPQTMVEVPFSEIILIARHVRTAELHTYLSSTALDDIRNPSTPPPDAVDTRKPSDQRFMVDVVIRRGEIERRMSVRGRDIYAFTAPLICEAAMRLLKGKFNGAGAQSPGAIFDAQAFLAALAPEYLTLEPSSRDLTMARISETTFAAGNVERTAI